MAKSKKNKNKAKINLNNQLLGTQNLINNASVPAGVKSQFDWQCCRKAAVVIQSLININAAGGAAFRFRKLLVGAAWLHAPVRMVNANHGTQLDGKRFIVRTDEMLTAFLELEASILTEQACPVILRRSHYSS